MRNATKNEVEGKPLDRSPAELKGNRELAAAWKKMLPRFDSAGVSWDQQDHALSLCQAIVNRDRAQRILDKDGVGFKDWRGKPAAHPQNAVWNKALVQLAKYGELLGLVGFVRTKQAEADETPEDDDEETENLLSFTKPRRRG